MTKFGMNLIVFHAKCRVFLVRRFSWGGRG